MILQEFLSLLSNVRKTGAGHEARCPAHEDDRASLSVNTGDDGRILVRCHAGCSFNEITRALDLKPADFFPPRDNGNGRRKWQTVETYDYRNATGGLLFQVRKQVNGGAKRFIQRHKCPDSPKGWTWGLGDKLDRCKCPRIEPVLYRLPELAKADPDTPVLLLEGEKDVLSAERLGFVATCNPMGAGSWRDHYAKSLAGRHVVIIPDNDSPGWDHALDEIKSVLPVAASVQALNLPGLQEKQDLSDWINAGGTADQLRALIAECPELESAPKRPDLPHHDDPLRSLRALPVSPDPDELDRALRLFGERLTPLDSVSRATWRDGAIKLLKAKGCSSPAKLVDAAVPVEPSGKSDSPGLALADLEPWPHAVNGAKLLDEIHRAIASYLVLPQESAVAASLWTLFAHAHDAFSISPILAITSPEKRCGKSLLLDVLALLTPRVLLASGVTSATVFRAIERFHPTMLLDEAETYLKDNEELRGVLNSGHRRSSAIVVRCVGDSHEVRAFSTWCPKSIALIGALAATLEDRSVLLHLRRKAPGERVAEYRQDHAIRRLQPLCRQAARWATDHMAQLREADPEVPAGISSDRFKDNWRPMWSVADVAGGPWPARARQAAVKLAAVEPDAESARVLLLEDIRSLFQERGADRLTSKAIVDHLHEMEERPWPEWGRAKKPISATAMAKLLKGFQVKPRQYKRGGDTARGYLLRDLRDAFNRYLGGINPVPRYLDGNHSGNSESNPVPHQQKVPGGNDENPNDINEGTGVPVGKGGSRGNAVSAAFEEGSL